MCFLKLPHTKLVLFDGCFAAVYVYPFNAQNLRFVIVDVVSDKLLTININNLDYIDYSHSIVAGGLLLIS